MSLETGGSTEYASQVRNMIFFGWSFVIASLISLPILHNLDNSQTFEITLLLVILCAVYGLYHGPTGVWAVLTLPNVETRFTGYRCVFLVEKLV